MLRRFHRFLLSSFFYLALLNLAQAAESDYFIMVVDATIDNESPVGQRTIPTPNNNFQLFWEEVGNEAGNNSGGAVHITAADPVLNFGSSGIYRIKIDPDNVPTGVNNFGRILFNNANDRLKIRIC